MATSRVDQAFNERVQHDLLFVSPTPGREFSQKDDQRAEPWQHMIDTTTRYTQARILDARTSAALLHGIETLWIWPFGAPKFLETDQESGLITEEAKVYFARLGTQLVEKGVGSYVRMLETHHRMLRTMFLRLVSQAKEEGITCTSNHLLTSTVTPKNALVTVAQVGA